MGRGNWRPYRDPNLFEVRYFDLDEHYKDDGADLDPYLTWEWFKEEIEQALPKSFSTSYKPALPVQYPYNDFEIIAANELVALVAANDAESWHLPLAFVVVDDDRLRGFAGRYMKKVVPDIWEAIGGPQQIRLGPWISRRVR